MRFYLILRDTLIETYRMTHWLKKLFRAVGGFIQITEIGVLYCVARDLDLRQCPDAYKVRFPLCGAVDDDIGITQDLMQRFCPYTREGGA